MFNKRSIESEWRSQLRIWSPFRLDTGSISTRSYLLIFATALYSFRDTSMMSYLIIWMISALSMWTIFWSTQIISWSMTLKSRRCFNALRKLNYKQTSRRVSSVFSQQSFWVSSLALKALQWIQRRLLLLRTDLSQNQSRRFSSFWASATSTATYWRNEIKLYAH